jgi:diguanylate cyclase (GGDEF)-like protein
MTFKDGSKRYESRDGYSLVTSADGKRALEQDAKAGSVRMTEVGPDGKSVEIYAWKSDGKGGLAGHFRGTRFNATVGEHIQLTPDGSRLFITGKGPDGQPVSRWYDKSGAMGKILAGGLGELVLAKDEDGFVRKDIVLYPKVLAKAADGQLDLSPLKNDLPAGQLEKFGAFLNSLSQFGELFNQSLRGTGSSALSDAFIRDGKLYLKLGSREMIVDIMPDGVTRAFYQASHTTFLWKFDASGTKCEQFTPDAKAEVQENRLAFNLSRRYEKQGSTWVQTLNIPLKMEDAPSGWKMAGGAALDTLGTAGEIVFSPFQTAHHGIHAGLVSGMGHAAGVGNFADMDAIYTLRQATFNKWLGQGLETHDQVLEAYGQGLPSDPAKRKEVEGFVDTKVEEYRKQRWGEAYDLHKDEKITRDERAYAAARVFGLSNLAQNYFDAGKESYRNGSTAGAVGNYAVGAFAIGGQMYVQGFGFGAAAQGLKVMAVGARTGLTAEQVAAAAQRAALLERGAVGVAGLTKAETTAVGMLKTASRVETAMFVAPGGAQVGISGYQGIKSWRAGETSAALGHLDNFISGAASFLIPMGIGKGSQMTNDVVVKVTQMKGTETTTVRKGQDELVADKRKLDGDAADHAQRILLTDSMTELPNRSWMERNAEQLAAKLAKPTVAVMDMNNFGAVNDGLIGINGPSKGRALADTILSKAGFRLLRLAQAHDVQIARFGGEEFAVVGEQQAVLKFLDASKLEFQDGQVLRDVGYGPESKEMKAITAATAARNRAGQSIGDFTTGVASMKGRGFTDSWHAADLALKSAKETPGGRGNAFAERVGEDGKPAYELTTPALDASEIEAQNAAKAGRDAKVGTHTPRDIADDIHELKGKLTAEEYQKFKKVAFVDPLTQTREYDYVRAQAPEWAQKYAKGGEATLMSARGLKLINDALGHEAGDRYLTALGRELRNIVIDQRAGGNWLEEPARVASKDFLVVGQKAGPAARALDKAMRRVMASEEVLSKEQRAQVAELARSRGEDPNLTGTLRVVDSPFVHDAGGQADMFATMDHLIDLSDSAKQKEQPVPPAPPVVTSKH